MLFWFWQEPDPLAVEPNFGYNKFASIAFDKKNMHVSWLGNTGIRIQTKPFDKDIVVVIDPYKQEEGTFPRSLTPDIALFTRGINDSITLSGEPFTLSTPGECETKGVLITAVQGHGADNVMYRIDTEQMSLGHLGFLNQQPTDAQLGVLSGVDILCIPVGGNGALDPESATKAINAIEPRVIIPIAFKSDNDPHALSIESFLKAIGINPTMSDKKAIFKKKDLPQEDMQVIVLAKE